MNLDVLEATDKKTVIEIDSDHFDPGTNALESINPLSRVKNDQLIEMIQKVEDPLIKENQIQEGIED